MHFKTDELSSNYSQFFFHCFRNLRYCCICLRSSRLSQRYSDSRFRNSHRISYEALLGELDA